MNLPKLPSKDTRKVTNGGVCFIDCFQVQGGAPPTTPVNQGMVYNDQQSQVQGSQQPTPQVYSQQVQQAQQVQQSPYGAAYPQQQQVGVDWGTHILRLEFP